MVAELVSSISKARPETSDNEKVTRVEVNSCTKHDQHMKECAVWSDLSAIEN